MDQGKPESVAQVTPYEGLEDYIFISYSHRDTATVLPLLHRMKAEGYRFWYDEGIDPGSEWPESIAAHLGQCRVCLAFMSSTSLASQNCRREINFALSKNKEFLSVILEPVEMSPGMEMQISTYQSILKYKYHQEEQFLNRLLNLELLKSCREPRPAPAAPQPQPAPAEPASAVSAPTTPAPAVSAPTTPAPAAPPPAAPVPPVGQAWSAPPMGQAWPASQSVRPAEPKPAPAGMKKWLPFAIAGGAVLLVVIIAVFALSGGFKPKLTINGKVYRDDAVTQRITGTALSVKQLKTLASFQECRYLYLTDCTLESGALEQLAGMEKLYHLEVVSCQGVGDLSFLDELPRLMHLVISDCGLTKVPELSDPARITELSLAGNPLDGLTGLSAWTGLASLDVSGCGLASLTGLEGLQSIKWLYAADNQIVDLTPLSTLIYLSTLDLKNNQVESLVPLAYCQLLSVVSLRNNPDCLCVDDILPLSAATLTKLDISGIHNVASLDFLSECSILTELYADDCTYLMTCEGLSGCPALTRLSLAHCQIYDIADLAGLAALKYLNLADNLIYELPNLGRLGADATSPVYVFSNNELTDLSNLPRLNYFGLMVDGNPLTDLSALGAMKGTYLVFDCTELTPLEPLEETGFTSIYATYVFIGKQVELEGNSHFRKAVSREEAFELVAGSNFTPDF